jgi:hypothetical protein
VIDATPPHDELWTILRNSERAGFGLMLTLTLTLPVIQQSMVAEEFSGIEGLQY